jgi:NADPH:quinone reductase-like Zn-dependent oxidoreductase
MKSVTVVCVREFGEPANAALVESREPARLKPGQVRVKVLAVPINPADLNVLEGKYALKPNLPAVVGNEGVGMIIEIGRSVKRFVPGQRVIAPAQPGWWATERVLDARDLIAVPDKLPVEIAAMMSVNPPTAFRLISDFVDLREGDWLVQNAANSAVGRFVIQIARQKHFRTINVVRRRELVAELKGEGADVVLTEDEPLADRIVELTDGGGARLGLNAVGGESARQLAKSLTPRGTLVTFGAMGREPLRIDNGLLIFKDVRFRGFLITQWFHHASRRQIEMMFAELFSMKLHTPVEKTYPLEKAREAIEHAGRSGRSGKILFVMPA